MQIPSGYVPITYGELAHMTGMPLGEIKTSTDEMKRSRVLDIVQIGGLLFYKLNIGKEERRCLT